MNTNLPPRKTARGDKGTAERTSGLSAPAPSVNPAAAVAEIVRLHHEILEAARTTLPKVVRIGKLLTTIKAGLVLIGEMRMVSGGRP